MNQELLQKNSALLKNIVNLKMEYLSTIHVPNFEKDITIAIFDLKDSTEMKRNDENKGIAAAKVHNNFCASVIQACSGKIIKGLGDGILARFDKPQDACIAAVNILNGISQSQIQTKGAITIGRVDPSPILGQVDVMGSVVDRCARVLSKCEQPNQVLVEEEIFKKVNQDLIPLGVKFSEPIQKELRNFGTTTVHEIN